ncbi:membrane protein, partial [Candidatus Bathyarchaeota archaeon]|nr:membrane protein [Candidatus Bathyarchaeota archaeon]
MTLYADLGMGPWGVLQVGLTKYMFLTFGQVSQVVGLVVLVLGWVLGFPPGLGTVMNIYFIGYFMDLIMAWGLVPMPRSLPGQLALLMG